MNFLIYNELPDIQWTSWYTKINELPDIQKINEWTSWYTKIIPYLKIPSPGMLSYYYAFFQTIPSDISFSTVFYNFIILKLDPQYSNLLIKKYVSFQIFRRDPTILSITSLLLMITFILLLNQAWVSLPDAQQKWSADIGLW